jgi:hypothetical protein
MSQRVSRHPSKPCAYGTALSVLLASSFALAAADEPTPAQRMDKASQQISEALAGLSQLKLEKGEHEGHLSKARSLLARARAELLQAQGQAAPGE